MRNQLFLSHTWSDDIMGRNNHERVKKLQKYLIKKGWTVWLDDTHMKLNLDASMVEGIEHADVFIVCFTNEYNRKVNEASYDSKIRSNVLKEWTYANARKKLMILIHMEPFKAWPIGILTMYLSNLMYIDGSGDDIKVIAQKLTELLHKINIRPIKSCSSIFKRKKKVEVTNDKVEYISHQQNKKHKIVEKIDAISSGSNCHIMYF